jgi:hypothetical protein
MYGDARLPANFWSKVTPMGNCWLWTGAKSRGYGSFRHPFSPLPHRVSYRMLVGEIPEGHEIDHLCRNTLCVRPDHLEPVTPRVNVLRSGNVAAHYAARDECKWGHPFSPENTEMQGTVRLCLTCRAHNSLRQSLARRAKNFGNKYPDMVCKCGEAAQITPKLFDYLESVFCVFCGQKMKPTHKARW